MADCKKDTNIPLLNGSLLMRKIRFTSDRKTIELVLLDPTGVECTNNIDSNGYLGIKIQGNNLVFTNAINGLTTNLYSNVSDNPLISIVLSGGGVLSVIGVDDGTLSFSVTQLNVRYDASTNSVKFQI
jgi:hypothetical protein